jgi:hypothetical protein
MGLGTFVPPRKQPFPLSSLVWDGGRWAFALKIDLSAVCRSFRGLYVSHVYDHIACYSFGQESAVPWSCNATKAVPRKSSIFATAGLPAQSTDV